MKYRVGDNEPLIDRDAKLLGQIVQCLVGRHAGAAQLVEVKHQVADGAEVIKDQRRIDGLALHVLTRQHLVLQLVLSILHGFVVGVRIRTGPAGPTTTKLRAI